MTNGTENKLLPNVNLCYAYILAIIQPARIQEIIKYKDEFLEDFLAKKISNDDLKEAHEFMRANNFVFSVRRGSYCLKRSFFENFSGFKLMKQIVNSRMFLMKKQRHRLK